MVNGLKIGEVSDVLLKQLQDIKPDIHLSEVGTVLQVSDGVARIYGLHRAESNELLEFKNGMKAIVMNLEEDNVGAVLLGPTDMVEEGDVVTRTGKIASIQVGEGLLGRVVDALGNAIDGLGPVTNVQYEMPLERKAPGVIFRQPVNEPLQTGIKAIDAMIPIGRGQREFTSLSTKSATTATPRLPSGSPAARPTSATTRSIATSRPVPTRTR